MLPYIHPFLLGFCSKQIASLPSKSNVPFISLCYFLLISDHQIPYRTSSSPPLPEPKSHHLSLHLPKKPIIEHVLCISSSPSNPSFPGFANQTHCTPNRQVFIPCSKPKLNSTDLNHPNKIRGQRAKSTSKRLQYAILILQHHSL